MKSTPRKIVVGLVIFVVVTVVMAGLSIWLDTGPALLSP
jgi:CHASE3 domain sensor protein